MKTDNLIEKDEGELNRYFWKKDIQMVNKHVNKCMASL